MSLFSRVVLALVVVATFAGLGLIAASCGYDGQYRYPCQDPSNWDTEECKPPQCEAGGTCPEMIFGSVPE